jgi:hypothetical protein
MSKIAILVVSLIVILAGSGLILNTTAADYQTAVSPTRTLGDRWTMSVNDQMPSGMKGTLTNEVTSTSVLVSGYDCTEFTMTGGGTNSGGVISGQGSWTMNGKQYETKTNYSKVKSSNTMESSTATFNETIMTATDFNPPQDSWSFPLFVGKNWTTITTQTIVSQHILNGDYSQGNETKKVTFNFIVLRTEDIVVPAGEFQTFVLRMVLIDNTPNNGTSSDFYYSAKAHNTVKELDYLPSGNLVFSLELLNYSITETTPTPTITLTINPTQAQTSNPTTKPTPQPTTKSTTNLTPAPTVPEFSWLVIVPLLLSMFFVIMVLRHRKTITLNK